MDFSKIKLLAQEIDQNMNFVKGKLLDCSTLTLFKNEKVLSECNNIIEETSQIISDTMGFEDVLNDILLRDARCKRRTKDIIMKCNEIKKIIYEYEEKLINETDYVPYKNSLREENQENSQNESEESSKAEEITPPEPMERIEKLPSSILSGMDNMELRVPQSVVGRQNMNQSNLPEWASNDAIVPLTPGLFPKGREWMFNTPSGNQL